MDAGARLEAGFDAAGVAAVAGTSDGERLDAARFAAWVEAGRAGEMEYLKRRDEHGVLLRSGVQVAMPWAQSVIVCALNYNAEAPLSIDGSGGWNRMDCSLCVEWERADAEVEGLLPTDYHDELLGRLRRL